ncbi:UDP-N-acetylmuramoyl-tripeptide--D-alanyl-D-alanine ligase [Patescibacteria group bacterium]|nr:UDP-N-acetylmuramoyl-tripeptide--D-alanyl-D-alanine ligase [Patescibacteria group bacterium]MBU1028677.1 UDP-N-acetylmuramoyl-tripeptide--D-alanyl-D-alanine ligase [Patescibacteria group bacterium]MBU1916158.1 UDP-N-acetylmuramoyl-tripeptide--D-alanyl-D-alanine ligase [Patescibacteria group bacterium]
MKKFVEQRLARQAKRLLARKKPVIIGITGSVGKSAAKNCIGAILGGSFNLRISPKNYNTEFGLPLTVLGLKATGRSAMGWLNNLIRGWWRSNFGGRNYPDTLVLEMATDHPGDISKLVAIAPPNIGVVTTIGESHLEFFGSVAAIAAEKSRLAEAVPATGVAVLNRDDDLVWAMRKKTKAQVVSIGFHEESDVRALADTVKLACRQEAGCGTHFKIEVDGATMPIFIRGALGWPTIYAVLAAVAVGRARGLNMMQMVERLKDFEPAPGRLHYVPGIKGTILIDDTYNAAPKSVYAALEVLCELPLIAEDDKRFAVLGDMLELGQISDQAHADVGRRAAELGIDYLVLVGERMLEARKAAVAAGMSEDRVLSFSKNLEAGKFVQSKMKPGDAILIKGSRGMQMEFVVKELMAEPLRAADLLPGDHQEWRV